MTFQEMYNSKLRSVEETAKVIKSGDVLFSTGSCATPVPLINALVDRALAGEVDNVRVVATLQLAPNKMIMTPGLDGKVNYETCFYGGYDKVGVKNGNTIVNSIQFGKMARYLKEIRKPNILMVDGTPMDENGYISLGSVGVTWAAELAEYAEKIIINVNRKQFFVPGERTKLHISKIDHLCECDFPLQELPQPEVTDNDRAIAEIVLPEIPDGSCIQIGLGGLANAIGYGLMKKKNLSIRTEMITDSMVALAKAGIINGRIHAAFGLGNLETYEFCMQPNVELEPISIVANPFEIGKVDNFISINSCLTADLQGQAASESIGPVQYSSTGGQLEFVRGAALSKGGKSFLCMPATFVDKDGKLQSKVCFNLPAGSIVTTPRTDAMYFVTEFGIADVFLKPIEERVEAMISIAHPDFRDELREQAISVGWLRK